jgi:flavin-dependent dehydrogenase
VIGGGPAGSFFSYFLLDMAGRVGLDLEVDVYEPRDYTRPAPYGCNMCGGIVSESLVQTLATEGIILPPETIERGIDSYVLHTDVGSVRIGTPTHEMRIAAVYRGAGPRDAAEGSATRSFDGYLQKLAVGKGARVVRERVSNVERTNGRFAVKRKGADPVSYDLVAVATGINSGAKTLLDGLDLSYRPPRATKTVIQEYRLGEEGVRRTIGTSMHVFLLDIRRLEFAAVIPKGEYATICLLGEDIDKALVDDFLSSAPLRRCLPVAEQPPCHCSPRIAVQGAFRPYDDRLLFIGDCGVTRLYKDGIGAAYRTAKAAAKTVVFHGVAAADFERHYWPACYAITKDNTLGGWIFSATRLVQRMRFARRAILRMVAREQRETGMPRMSMILWDLFSGSAPYRDILKRGMHPTFLARLAGDLVAALAVPQDVHQEEVAR